MTESERQKRNNHPKVLELKKRICTKDSDKYYLFVSYKSDDWEIVLTEIVYKLVIEYGLNVYYDGSFDLHNESWIEQMPDNMNSYKCVGILAFLDMKYSTSYATLMELMHSQTFDASEEGLPIIPVDLEALCKVSGKEGDDDTMLGVITYPDVIQNLNAGKELELFKEDYKELTGKSLFKEITNVYKEGRKFSKRHCNTMVRGLLASKGYNINMYSNTKSFYDNLVSTIRNTCNNGEVNVFSEATTAAQPLPDAQTNANTPYGYGTMTLSNNTTYEGEIKNGKPNGYGTVKYSNGDTIEGERINGKLNGICIIRYNNKEVFEAEFKNGKLIEGTRKRINEEIKTIVQGTKTFSDGSVYTGELKNGLPHGQGTMEYLDGTVYEGGFKYGKRDGHCIQSFPDGEIYKGEFKDDKKSGKGTYKFYNGNVYTGEFKDDMFDGHGVYKFFDGEVYEGEFKDDMCDGQGTLTYSNGSIYTGEWKNDKPNGQGTMTYHDGSMYKGEFKDGKPNGQGTLKLPNKSVYNGEFKDGLPNGQGIITFPDSEVYEGEFKDGLPNGQGTLTLPNKTVYKGEFKDGKKNGRFTTTLPNGAIVTIDFVNDEPTYVW